MEQKSMQVYAVATQAAQKFNYFISGLTGALLAYISQGLHPRVLSFGPPLLEPLAILLLLLSFFYGMKRIQCGVAMMSLNQQDLELSEKMKLAANITVFPSTNWLTGDVFSNAEERDLYLEKSRVMHASIRVVLDEFGEKELRAYDLRQLFLYAGFIVLVLHRFIMPYGPWGK